MPKRTSRATWSGGLQDGEGTMALGSGAWEGPYSFRSRFEDGAESNPEELVAAAHAGCFSMALANNLDGAGHAPESVETVAEVTLEMRDQEGPTITRSHLDTEVSVPGVDQETFEEVVEESKRNCPVSRALGAIEVSVEATRTG